MTYIHTGTSNLKVIHVIKRKGTCHVIAALRPAKVYEFIKHRSSLAIKRVLLNTVWTKSFTALH